MNKIYKDCYEYAKKVNYSISLMGEVAKKYHISLDLAFKYARDYYVYMLGNSLDSWNLLLDGAKSLEDKKKDAMKLRKMIMSSEGLHNLYIMLGEGSYEEFEAKLPKYCYEYCDSVWFDINMVKEHAIELGMSYYKFREYAKRYALDILGHDSFELISSNSNLTNEIKKKELLTVWINYSPKREKCYNDLGGGTYDEFKSRLLKQTYNYSKMVNFNKDKMIKYGKLYDISYVAIRRYVWIYAKEVLLMNDKQIDDMFNNKYISDRKVDKWINGSSVKKTVYESLGYLPYDEFRMALYKMCYEYAESVEFDPDKIRLYATEIGVSYISLSNYLRKYAFDVLKLTEEEWRLMRNKRSYQQLLETWINSSSKHKELYDKLGGGNYVLFHNKLENFCYIYALSVNYDYQKLEEFGLRWDIPLYRIKVLLTNYGKKHPGYASEINIGLEKINVAVSNKKYKNYIEINFVLEKLEKAIADVEIKKVLSGVDAKKLYSYVPSYVMVNYKDIDSLEKNKIIKDLHEKIIRYLNNKVVDDETVEDIDYANGIIKDFIDSDISSIKEYCNFKKIKVSEFNRLVGLVKKYNDSLYEMYQLKISRYRNKIYAKLVFDVNTIIKGIKDGVIENNEVRQFDLFDYYMITKIPFDLLLKITSDSLNSSDMVILKEFINKNSDFQDVISIDDIMGSHIEINGKIILDYEKMAIINYLKELGMPVNYQLFSIVLNKYMSGKFMIFGDKQKRKLVKCNDR